MAKKTKKPESAAADTATKSDEFELPDDYTPDGDDWFGGQPTKKAAQFWPSAKRLIGLLAPEKALFSFVVVLVILSVILTVIAPKIMGQAVDVIWNGVQGHTPIDFVELSRLILTVIGLYVVASVLMWWQGYILNGLVMRVIYKLREDIEAKLNRIPLRYFDSRQRGDVLSRVTNDVDNIQQALQQAFSQMVQSLLTVIGIAAMMFIVSWQLALIALIALPLSGVIIGIVGVRAQKLFVAQWKQTGAVNGHIEEAFTGHELVRVFNRDEEMAREFDERNEALFQASYKAQALSGTMMPSMQFVQYLSYVLIAVVGAFRVTAGQITLGEVTAFIQYSREFAQPISELGSMANMLQSGVASAERTFELLDAEEQEPETARESLPQRSAGRVEFDAVSFSYEPDQPLIEGLSLTASPGETVAIVGPTGAGKTTLVNLIMRFYELNAGKITLDGVDITNLSRAELRGQVGMVLQDAFLFEGTIRENIRYGRLSATDDEVVAAAQATMVDRFVRQLPDGYDTVIEENASTLSAGERQLLTIARAFIADPSLLILDEATSSVDTRTEVLVQHAMQALRSDRTSFVIAHRLSTIRDADTILMMESGRIVEQGSHTELLARGGAYYALYQSQFAGESEGEAVAATLDLDVSENEHGEAAHRESGHGEGETGEGEKPQV